MKRCKETECLLYGKQKRVGFKGDTEETVIAFVGESPSVADEAMNSSFVGMVGDLLFESALKTGLSNYPSFLLNAAMCRIKKEEMKLKQINTVLASCRPHLERALLQLKPKVIVTLGAMAAQQLLRVRSLNNVRGVFVYSEEFNCHVLPSYSPMACLKNPSFLPILLSDFTRVRTFIENDFQILDLADTMIEERETIQDIIESATLVAVDTETQGLDYINPTNVMVSYSLATSETRACQVYLHELEGAVIEPTADNSPETAIRKIAIIRNGGKADPESFVIPWEVGSGKKKHIENLRVHRCSNFYQKVEELKLLLENPKIKKVFMNGNYDLHHIEALFRNHDLVPPKIQNYAVDIQSLAHLIDENLFSRCSLETLRKSFTSIASQYDSEFNSGFDKSNMLSVPQKELTYYAGMDACVTYSAAQGLVKRLKKEPLYERQLFYYKNMVMPVSSVLFFQMEENGVMVDSSALPEVRQELQDEQALLYARIIDSIPHVIRDKYCGINETHPKLTKVNLIKEMMYSPQGLNLKKLVDKRTKKPIDSADKKVRAEYLSQDLKTEAIDFLMNYDRWKMIDTLLSRYIAGIEKATRIDGRIHPSFSLAVTATGRSCLSEDTLIATNYGDKSIKNVKAGDYVWSIHEDTKDPCLGKVKWAGKTGIAMGTITVSYMRLGVGRIKRIECTPKHKFLMGDGTYLEASKLKKGDLLCSSLSAALLAEVTSVDLTLKYQDVYDIEMEQAPNNFLANEVFVHNSSSSPNLQNIPKRGPISKSIRKLFCSRPGWSFISADLSQAELRFAAALSGDPTMCDIYINNGDIHSTTAESVAGKTKEEMTEAEFKIARQNAKCFHPETEVLTKHGWMALKDISYDTEVMQAVPVDNEGIALEWATPSYLEMRPNHMESLVHIKSENINLKVTPDHRMLVQRSTGKFDVVPPNKFIQARYFWNAGIHNVSSSELPLEERIIRLMVATQADGSISKSRRVIRFGFYKQRKIDRLLSLLKEGEYTLSTTKNGKNRPVTCFYIQKELALKILLLLNYNKEFTWDMLNWPLVDRLCVLDEIQYWDSCVVKKSIMYSSTRLQNCEVIQAICNISGRKSKLFKLLPTKQTHNIGYKLSIQQIGRSRGDNGHKYSGFSYNESLYKDKVAVITVPSSFLLVRNPASEGAQIPVVVGQCVSFGFLYKASWQTFKRVAKLDYGLILTDEQAQEFRKSFFTTYPRLLEYHERTIDFAKKYGYIVSPLGRVRHLVDINSMDQSIRNKAERQAVNHSIQSVSSDSALLSGLEIMKEADPEECKIVLFVHDEQTFEVKDECIDKYARIIKYHMTHPPLEKFGFKLTIPMGSDLKVGKNLASMKDYIFEEEIVNE